MKKIISLIIIDVIILSCMCIVNAKTEVSNDKIISISSERVSPSEEFYLILNLSQIPYSKFKVEITNTSSLQVEDITIPVTELSKNNVVTSFVVDKESITLEKLGIVYNAPKQNSNVKFSIKLTDLSESVDDFNKKLSVLELEIKELQNSLTILQDSLGNIENTESEEYKKYATSIENATKLIESKTEEKENLSNKINNFEVQTLSEEIIVNVDENKNDAIDKEGSKNDSEENSKKNLWDDKDFLIDEMMKEKDRETNISMKKMVEQMNNLEFDLKSANDRISSLTQSITYQGSQNNYLSNLSIIGAELKNNFKKTTTTYFANVDPTVTNVTVNAIAEDSSSIVTIYGNTNLQEGKNKVIINVTADDGSVRTYKIYITK